MDTKETFTEAVKTGREIEFSHRGQHYFESRHGDKDWYIYHEETGQEQHFPSCDALLRDTLLGGQNINEVWDEITLDCIL